MIRRQFWGLALFGALLMMGLVGCNNQQQAGPAAANNGNKKPAAYEPKHGPAGGHLLDLDTEAFGAEWHQSSKHNKITITFLDAENKAAKPAKVDAVTIRSTSRSDGKSWELEAGAKNENGEVSEFALDDEELHRAMTMGIRIEMKVGGETVSAIVPEHVPHMHD